MPTSSKASRRLLSRHRTPKPHCKLQGCTKLARSGCEKFCAEHFKARVSNVAAVACLVCQCAALLALPRSIYPSVFFCFQHDNSYILQATAYTLHEIAAFRGLPSTCCNNLCYLPRTFCDHLTLYNLQAFRLCCNLARDREYG